MKIAISTDEPCSVYIRSRMRKPHRHGLTPTAWAPQDRQYGQQQLRSADANAMTGFPHSYYWGSGNFLAAFTSASFAAAVPGPKV